MPPRQYGTPHVVNSTSATALKRLDFDDRSLREGWFQKLLYTNPSLIPVDAIEPVFGPLIPLARELQTDCGPVDVVYINPAGYITLVETKLWRNPEARRAVVAQIIEYATGLARWTYTDLCDAVRRAQSAEIHRSYTQGTADSADDPVMALVRDHIEFDEARFVDQVTHNLRKGRFLLLVVGDGIKDDVEDLAQALEKSPHLGYTLSLVETAVYQHGANDGEYVVMPRVLLRTREVVRFVVEISQNDPGSRVTVKAPDRVPGGRENRPRGITEAVFFEDLEKSVPEEVVEFAKWLQSQARATPGFSTKISKLGMAVFWHDESGDHTVKMMRVRRSGEVSGTEGISELCAELGLADSIVEGYQQGLGKLLGSARRTLKRSGRHTEVKDPDGSFASVVPLAAKQAEVWKLLSDTAQAIEDALTKREEDSQS